MSIFKSLGRSAQRFKQKYTDDDNYGCLSCGEVLDDNYQTCPHCDSDEVVLIE